MTCRFLLVRAEARNLGAGPGRPRQIPCDDLSSGKQKSVAACPDCPRDAAHAIHQAEPCRVWRREPPKV